MKKSALLRLLKMLTCFAVLWILFTAIMYIRYPYAFTRPNFYAEDGKIFVANMLALGPLEAIFQLFNGYLIVGQYLVLNVAFFINFVAGGEFVTLPKAIALASYLFLGLLCCLPWLLFRKQLGNTYSILAGALIALVPLGSFDWTVIGTVGNLKFAFLYAAFMLIMYRNNLVSKSNQKIKLLITDVLIVLCVFTNITVLGLLPLALLPYRKNIKQFVISHDVKQLLNTYGLISIILLGFMGVIYVISIYLIGIPKNEGYLDQPLNIVGLLNIVYRGSLYGLLYPLQASMTTVLSTLLLIAVTIGVLYLRDKNRIFAVASIYAILVSVFGFALTRTGVTEHYLEPTVTGGPGQFFYGGTMIFIFAVTYLVSQYVRPDSTTSRAVLAGVLTLYFVWAVPQAGYREKSLADYSSVPTIAQTLENACKPSNNDNKKIDITIYPSQQWYMNVDRNIACQ